MPWIFGSTQKVSNFPSAKGSYILALQVSKTAEILFGRFSLLQFEPGIYLYFGSALGPGGIQGRLRHHLRITDKPHWHIDWLRQVASLVGVYYQVSTEPLECIWFQKTSLNELLNVPVMGFGSSDCSSGCQAHLLFTPLNRWSPVHLFDGDGNPGTVEK